MAIVYNHLEIGRRYKALVGSGWIPVDPVPLEQNPCPVHDQAFKCHRICTRHNAGLQEGNCSDFCTPTDA
jgi:hypothetical protein